MNAALSSWPLISQLATWAWQASLAASLLMVPFLVLARWSGRWWSPTWRYALGLLILTRLIWPVAVPSSWSWQNLLARRPAVVRLESPPHLPTAASVALVEGTASLPAAGFAALVDAPPIQPAVANAQSLPTRSPHRLAVFWAGGMVFVLVFAGWRWRRFHRRVRKATPVTDPVRLAILAECCRLTQVRTPVPLLLVRGLGTPALFGWRRPVILLPEELDHQLDPLTLRMVILHELAHLKSGDVGLNWLMTLAGALHWFNPLAWLSLQRLRADREMVRDAQVLSWLAPVDRPAYGHALLNLAACFSGRVFCPSFLPVLNHPQETKKRIHMIACFQTESRARLLGLGLLLAALAGVTFTQTRAAGTPPKPDDLRADEVVARQREEQSKDKALQAEKEARNALAQAVDVQRLQVLKSQDQLDRLRQELAAMGANVDLNTGDPLKYTADRLSQLSQERARTSIEHNAIRAQRERLKQAKSSLETAAFRQALLTALPDDALSKLMQNLWDAEGQLAKLKVDFGPDAPQFKQALVWRSALDEKVEERVLGILAGLQIKEDTLALQSEQLAKQMAEFSDLANQLSRKLAPYTQAQEELQSANSILRNLEMRKMQEDLDRHTLLQKRRAEDLAAQQMDLDRARGRFDQAAQDQTQTEIQQLEKRLEELRQKQNRANAGKPSTENPPSGSDSLRPPARF